MPQEAQPDKFDAGATAEGGLRLWRAKEAMRQAELRLAGQAAALTTLESRAQAAIGWAVAGATALTGGLLIAELNLALRSAGVVALMFLLTSIWYGLEALCPQDDWVFFGSPAALLGSEYETEVEEHEATAEGLAGGITHNSKRLARVGNYLRRSLRLIALAPPAALLAAAGAAALQSSFFP
jgi:hypothetical protein